MTVKDFGSAPTSSDAQDQERRFVVRELVGWAQTTKPPSGAKPGASYVVPKQAVSA